MPSRRLSLPLIGTILATMIGFSAPSAFALTVSLGDKAFLIDSGDAGKFSLPYPKLGTGNKYEAPSEVTVKDRKLSVKYANGAQMTGDLSPAGSISFHFTNLPAEAKGIRFDMELPLTLKDGSKFCVDSGKDIDFPAEAPKDAFLFKGDAKKFVIKPAKGDPFAITIEHGWQQVQDNRVWKTDQFYWMASADLPRANGNEAFYAVSIGDPAAVAKPAPAAPKAVTVAADVKVKLADKDISISASTAGSFGLTYPILKTGDKQLKPASVKVEKDTATLTYANGAKGTLTLEGTNLKLSFADLPPETKNFRMEMFVPINFGSGGTYSISQAKAQPFPAEKPAKPFLYQGNADSIELIHPTGPGFALSIPQYSFMQLQDNREWNWGIYSLWFETPIDSTNPNAVFNIKIAPPASGKATIKPMIDAFGQWANVDFPTKVKSLDELKADVAAEKEWMASLKPPATDTYGGLLGSGEKFGLKKTGFFHLGKIKRKDGSLADVLVTPEGNAFFQLGMCGISPCDDFTTVRGRESIYEWLPGRDKDTLSARRDGDNGVISFYLANTIRKYEQPYTLNTHFGRWIDRLRTWGFNSAGAFNQFPPIATEKQFPYVTFVPIPSLAKVGTVKDAWDPFTPGAEEKFDAAFAKSLAPNANNPLVIGYFISNEPLLEDVPKAVPNLMASKSPSKAKLMAMLEDKYKTIDALNAAWNLSGASFAELGEKPMMVTTRAAADDMMAFFKAYLEARYSLINKPFRKYAPNHLLIGDRWMPGTANSEILVSTAAKYLDVISINYYTFGIDKNFMDRIHTWANNKPMLFSEWYFASADQGLRGGNKVATQTDRGLAYRNYVEQSASLGYVVGMQWFLALDQAPTGRFFEGFNGEAANTGLVNVADRPYKEFLTEAMKTNYTLYDVIQGNRAPFSFDDPRFVAKTGAAVKTVSISPMVNPFVLDGSRGEWPSVPPYRIGASGLAHGLDAKNFEATFRLAWDQKNLYLFAEITDLTPMKNTNKPESIWNGDGIELFIGSEDIKTGGALKFSDRQILIRGAKSDDAPIFFSNVPKQYPAQVIVVPNLDGKGYTVEAAIPFEALGFVPQPNQEILFDIAIDDSDTGNGRSRQIVFNGNARNSKDRGVWGRAVLIK